MSETDSFIREVTEEVQQDRMFRLWKKYGAFVIGGIAVIVGVTAFISYQQDQELSAREERGGAFLAVEADDVDGLATIAADEDGATAALADFKRAQALAAAGDTGGAVAAYESAASRSGIGAHIADLARLEALRLGAASADPAATVLALTPLAEEGAPYRVLALELRASVHLMAGDGAAARSDLEAVLADPGASGESRARVQALLAVLGDAESGS